MSEVSSRFDWIRQFIADRVAQASDVESGTSETEVGLLPFNLVDEEVLRRALHELGFAIDAEPDPHRWVDRIPQKPAQTADKRYGKGRREVSSARVVTMWQQRPHHLAYTFLFFR